MTVKTKLKTSRKAETREKVARKREDAEKEIHSRLLYLIKDLSMKLSDIVILVDNRKEGNNLKEYIQD